MFKIILLSIFLTISAPVYAEENDSWSMVDTALLVTSSALISVDWAQTLHTARNPGKYDEINIVLGRQPSEGQVNTYFTATLIGNAVAAYVLKPTPRKCWLSFWIGVEGVTVYRNRRTPTNFGVAMHF